MHQAARELANRRGEAGLELQQEAQRLLERATPPPTEQEDEDRNPQSESEDGEKSTNSRHGQVPTAEKARRATDFRRRVLEGLSKDRRGRLAPAITRYAEGLLE